MADRNLFSDDAARRIAETVRRVEAQVKAMETRQRMLYSGDNEGIIDGICDGDALVDSVGECIPSWPVTDPTNISFWNPLGDVHDGDRIVIAYSHRSSQIAARNHDTDKPTPWILISAGCQEE